MMMLQKRPAPLRQPASTVLEEEPINEKPVKTGNAGVEAKKRKREEKQGQKEKRQDEIAEKRLKAPNNVQELLAELNILAEIVLRRPLSLMRKAMRCLTTSTQSTTRGTWISSVT